MDDHCNKIRPTFEITCHLVLFFFSFFISHYRVWKTESSVQRRVLYSLSASLSLTWSHFWLSPTLLCFPISRWRLKHTKEYSLDLPPKSEILSHRGLEKKTKQIVQVKHFIAVNKWPERHASPQVKSATRLSVRHFVNGREICYISPWIGVKSRADENVQRLSCTMYDCSKKKSNDNTLKKHFICFRKQNLGLRETWERGVLTLCARDAS